jgi:hypothetical protein
VHGPEGLRSFCHTKAVLVDRFGWSREAWWLPVPPGLAGATKRVMQLRYRQGLGNKLRNVLR